MITLPLHQTGTSSVEDLPVAHVLSWHECKALQFPSLINALSQVHHVQLALMALGSVYSSARHTLPPLRVTAVF